MYQETKSTGHPLYSVTRSFLRGCLSSLSSSAQLCAAASCSLCAFKCSFIGKTKCIGCLICECFLFLFCIKILLFTFSILEYYYLLCQVPHQKKFLIGSLVCFSLQCDNQSFTLNAIFILGKITSK